MARRLLLPIVLAPMALELLFIAGRRSLLLSDHMVSGLHSILQTVILLWLLRIAAVSVNKAEEAQRALASFPKLNPNPVVEADSAGRVSYANPAAEKLFPEVAEREKAEREALSERTQLYDVLGTLPVSRLLSSTSKSLSIILGE
jgi:PAS domain-containing protein